MLAAADAAVILDQIEGALAYLDTVGTRADAKALKRMRLVLTSAHRSLHNRMRDYFRSELVQLKMGLEERMKENLAMFSGGQRQALTLLMMVLSKPDLILLDEHTAALDPKNAQIVLELTHKFIREYKLTSMMITHNMSHAIEFGNRLLMMDKGEIIFDVEGEEKQALTVEKLIDKFHQIRHKTFENDRTLLSEE